MFSGIRFTKIDYIIFTALVLIFVASSVYFYETRLKINLNENQFISIGKVISIKNNVMKKNQSMLTWRKTEINDSILNQDEIFADQNSTAHIKLNNGNEFFLNPGSSIRIGINDKITNVVIPRGAVNLLASEANQLLINQSTIVNVEKSAMVSMNQSVKGARVDLLSGKAEILNSRDTLSLSRLKKKVVGISSNIVNDNKKSVIKKADIKGEKIHIYFENPKRKIVLVKIASDLSFTDSQDFKVQDSQLDTIWKKDEAFLQATIDGESQVLRVTKSVGQNQEIVDDSILATLINEIHVFYNKIKRNTELKEKYQYERSK